MSEPTDTIRRVNSDGPMTVPELRRAAATLDRYTAQGRATSCRHGCGSTSCSERPGRPWCLRRVT